MSHFLPQAFHFFVWHISFFAKYAFHIYFTPCPEDNFKPTLSHFSSHALDHFISTLPHFSLLATCNFISSSFLALDNLIPTLSHFLRSLHCHCFPSELQVDSVGLGVSRMYIFLIFDYNIFLLIF